MSSVRGAAARGWWVALAAAGCGSSEPARPDVPARPFHERAAQLLAAEDFDVKNRRAEVIELYRQGCAAGEARSCRVVIELADAGDAALRQATEQLVARCLDGERASCHALRSGTRTYPAGAELETTRALCERGLGMACEDAVALVDPELDSEDDVPPKPETIALLERSCQLGEPGGCTMMRLVITKVPGREGEREHWLQAEAAAMRARCAEGDPTQCFEDEAMRARGRATLVEMCGAGEVWACLAAPSGDATAAQLQAGEIACRLDPDGCDFVAQAYLVATPPDPQAARRAYARACAYAAHPSPERRATACAEAGLPPP